MTTPIYAGRADSAVDADKAAGEAIDVLLSMHATAQAFRSAINTDSATTRQALTTFYTYLTAQRVRLGELAAVEGFAASYLEKLPGAPVGHNPVTAYQAADGLGPRLVVLINSLWSTLGTLTLTRNAQGQITDAAVPVTGAARTTVLAQLDDVLACIV